MTLHQSLIRNYVPAGGNEIRIKCPFCIGRGKSQDTSGHLHINTRTGRWICFRCRAKGVTVLPDNIKSYQYKDVNREVSSPEKSISVWNDELPMFARPISEYARSRIPYHLWGVVPAWASPKMRGRLILPIFDSSDESIVYWTARAIYRNAMPKIKNPGGAGGKSSHLFMSPEAKYRPRFITVVEGPFDALNVPNGISLMGKTISMTQARMIARINPEVVVVALDPTDIDPEAEEASREIVWELSKRISGVIEFRMSGDKDAADVGYTGMASRIIPMVREAMTRGIS